MHRCFRIVTSVLSLAAAAGCAEQKKVERPKVVHASGVVRYHGQPLEGATVFFSNAAVNISASGMTDANGHFTLTAYEPGDGAAPGKNQVSVSKVQMPNIPGDKSKAPVFRSGGMPKPKWLIPPRYGSLATSGLTVEVPETGSDDLVVDLKGSAEK